MPQAPTSNPTSATSFRFTLRTFLLASLIVGIVAGLFGNQLLHIRHERAVAKELLSRGIECGCSYDVAGNTTSIELTSIHEREATPVNMKLIWPVNEDLKLLAAFPRLRALRIVGPDVSDKGLEQIPTLGQLQFLSLGGTESHPGV